MRETSKTQKEQAIGDGNAQKKRFSTILLDCPWDVQQKGKGGRGAQRHYSLMSLAEIESLPIPDLLEENAHVWMWVTNATLEHGFAILRKWGLTPRSVFTWVKPRMGLGVYLRNATEHILLATRGKAPILFNAQMNWGIYPLQSHSHKPEELHQVIMRCSPGPYLEMFARRPFPGWSVWGMEVKSDIDIPGFPVPDSPETRRKSVTGEKDEQQSA